MYMWAIKHKPSGKFLPAPRGRNGRGGTFVEIDDPGPPRLFHNETSAKSALRFWLAGKVHVERHYSGAPWGEEIEEDWKTIPQPHRKAEDMTIVRVTISEA